MAQYLSNLHSEYWKLKFSVQKENIIPYYKPAERKSEYGIFLDNNTYVCDINTFNGFWYSTLVSVFCAVSLLRGQNWKNVCYRTLPKLFPEKRGKTGVVIGHLRLVIFHSNPNQSSRILRKKRRQRGHSWSADEVLIVQCFSNT